MRMVFFDLETGGLDSSKHPIIQIAAVAVDARLKEIGWYEAKIDFDRSAADPAALELNSYSPEIWERESKPAPHVCLGLASFLKQYADVPMVSKSGRPYSVAQLAGYNADAFDGPFLRLFYQQHSQFLPAIPRVLCVLQRVAWLLMEHGSFQALPNLKLATVCAHFGVELPDAHDALADCRATVSLYRAIAAASNA